MTSAKATLKPSDPLDEELGERELKERPSGPDIYTVRLKARTAAAAYHAKRELYPLEHDGTKHEASGLAYIHVPDLTFRVGVYPEIQPAGPIGEVTSFSWEGMRHHDIASVRGLYYADDRALAVWDVDSWGRLDEVAHGRLWQLFESFLLTRFPGATCIFPDDARVCSAGKFGNTMPVMGRNVSTDDLIRELEAGGVLGDTRAEPPVKTRATRGKAKKSGAAAEPAGRTSALVFFLVAAVLVALVGALPFGSLALYPFSLFVTLIHESSHALAGVISGGSVQNLTLNSDLSGTTRIRGGAMALIAPAGYLGATLAGVGLLLTPLRYARRALAVLAAIPLAALVSFHPTTLFTAVWCAIFAATLGVAAWKLRPRVAAFLQIFLGVAAGLNAFRDLMVLIFISGSSSHIHTDADNMSRALFLPPLFWAYLWAVLSVALLLMACVVLFRRDFPRLRIPGNHPSGGQV